MKTKLIIALSVLLGSFAAHAITYTQPVKVEGGLVEGVVEDGVEIFRGIPFAAPPVGDLRWKAPQPADPWRGVLVCDEFAKAPLQKESARQPKGWKNTDEMNPAMSEDCLYLNVWTPEKRDAEPLPVMVWIYGGGFHQGATDAPVYRGDVYAKKGVVMVSIPYRLGVFGYLAHPELSRESGHGSGNYAFMDQLAGLKWVKENIAAFGGDPENITVFGQSAGSRSIQGLICSPLSEGLFQRAIPQSGCAIRSDAICLPLADNEKLGREFLESLGISTLEEMRAIDGVTLQTAYENSSYFPKFRPSVDGYVLTEEMMDATRDGHYLDIDYMIGYTKDDVPAADFPTTIGLWADNQVNNLGRRPVYVYSFDHPQPGAADKADSFGAKGVIHSAELPYMFGQVKLSSKPMTEADYELADRMSTYWTNFAKFGNPNGPTGGEWEPYSKGAPTVFHLDVK